MYSIQLSIPSILLRHIQKNFVSVYKLQRVTNLGGPRCLMAPSAPAACRQVRKGSHVASQPASQAAQCQWYLQYY